MIVYKSSAVKNNISDGRQKQDKHTDTNVSHSL